MTIMLPLQYSCLYFRPHVMHKKHSLTIQVFQRSECDLETTRERIFSANLPYFKSKIKAGSPWITTIDHLYSTPRCSSTCVVLMKHLRTGLKGQKMLYTVIPRFTVPRFTVPNFDSPNIVYLLVKQGKQSPHLPCIFGFPWDAR